MAFADDSLRFDGGIGAITVGGITAGAPVLNSVRGIDPGGRPWAIRKLRATVNPDGNIRVRGEGLVLAGGNAIGTPAIPRQVVASLSCANPVAPATTSPQFLSEPADLDANGNFEISGLLNPIPAFPCAAPVLLIRNFAANAAGAWFAAGILRTGGGRDD